MTFTIALNDPTDLLDEDGVLASGWFLLESRGVEVAIFKDRGCWIFPTTGDLVNRLAALVRGEIRKFELFAVDYGASVLVKKLKDQIVITNRQVSISLNLVDFSRAVVIGITELARLIDTAKAYEYDARLRTFHESGHDLIAALAVSSAHNL